jgi:hypothetical protein
MHDYSGHLNFFIVIVAFVIDIKSFYAINSDVMSMFADSSLYVLSKLEYVLISIDVLCNNPDLIIGN